MAGYFTSYFAAYFEVGAQVQTPPPQGGTTWRPLPRPVVQRRETRVVEIEANERRDTCRIELGVDWSEDDADFYLMNAAA